MSTRTIRDWRGLKHQLSRYSSDELANALACATDTELQLRRFVRSIEAELGKRAQAPHSSPA